MSLITNPLENPDIVGCLFKYLTTRKCFILRRVSKKWKQAFKENIYRYPANLKLTQITDAGLAHLRGVHTINLCWCEKITDDHRKEAHQVLENSIQILGLLTEAIKLAEDSTFVLDRSFGPSEAAEGGEPRIGRK